MVAKWSQVICFRVKQTLPLPSTRSFDCKRHPDPSFHKQMKQQENTNTSTLEIFHFGLLLMVGRILLLSVTTKQEYNTIKWYRF
jgi:hypothetical protein